MIQENTPICQEEELHPEAIRQVREKLPQDEVLYDLAELFKIFGDNPSAPLALAVLERWLATGAAGAVRADVLLALFERRVALDDGDGALRSLCRALGDGAVPETISGMTDASTTRNPRTPWTRSCGSTTAIGSWPMRQVPTLWMSDTAVSRR